MPHMAGMKQKHPSKRLQQQQLIINLTGSSIPAHPGIVSTG